MSIEGTYTAPLLDWTRSRVSGAEDYKTPKLDRAIRWNKRLKAGGEEGERAVLSVKKRTC
jgi:hypothetical protein